MPLLNAQLIRQLRDAEGLTQQELAENGHASRRAIQLAEAGKPVSAATYSAIAVGLRVRPPSMLLAENNIEFEQLVAVPLGGYVLADHIEQDIMAIPPVPAAEGNLCLKFLDEDARLGRQYADFHRIAYLHYQKDFVASNRERAPDTLGQLVQSAGAPPNVANGNVELQKWPSVMSSRLTNDQKLIWKFASNVYPRRQSHMQGDVWHWSTVQPQADAQSFHWARYDLAKHWDKWYPLIGWRFIAERFLTKRDEVLLLAWLELALVQWTGMPGMHKQGLFTLAQAFANTLAPR